MENSQGGMENHLVGEENCQGGVENLQGGLENPQSKVRCSLAKKISHHSFCFDHNTSKSPIA